MHFKKNAVHPLERFPLEIWQLIANNLDPFEMGKLKLSSMTLYTSLQKRKDMCDMRSETPRRGRSGTAIFISNQCDDGH